MVENNRKHERKTAAIPIILMKDDSPAAESGLDMTPLGMNVSGTVSAVVRNTSEEGLCVATDRKLEPDTQVDVKMVDTPISAGEDQLSECKARVVWCNHAQKTEKTTSYEIGLKITLKKSLPVLNWKTQDFGSVKCM